MDKLTINDGIYSYEVYYDYGKVFKICLRLLRENLCVAPVPDFASIKGITQQTRINLSSTFAKNCGIIEVDFTRWTHKHIVSMENTFSECISLNAIHGLETLDLSDCDSFSMMCYGCRNLREIDISNSRIDRSATTDKAFWNCLNLTTAVVSSRTPRFRFPQETTRVDIDAGVNRVFMERINSLESRLSEEVNKNASMSREIEELRSLVGELRARLDSANL